MTRVCRVWLCPGMLLFLVLLMIVLFLVYGSGGGFQRPKTVLTGSNGIAGKLCHNGRSFGINGLTRWNGSRRNQSLASIFVIFEKLYRLDGGPFDLTMASSGTTGSIRLSKHDSSFQLVLWTRQWFVVLWRTTRRRTRRFQQRSMWRVMVYRRSRHSWFLSSSERFLATIIILTVVMAAAADTLIVPGIYRDVLNRQTSQQQLKALSSVPFLLVFIIIFLVVVTALILYLGRHGHGCRCGYGQWSEPSNPDARGRDPVGESVGRIFSSTILDRSGRFSFHHRTSVRRHNQHNPNDHWPSFQFSARND